MHSFDSSNAAITGIAAVVMSFLWFFIILAIFQLICRWIIYTKAGKPGWACIVPFYNLIVLLDIVGKPTWWLLLMFIPIVNIVVIIIVINELSKRFGYGAGFTLGLIFLPFIFDAILAFGKAQYTPPGGGDDSTPTTV
jgi:hypothetical protein